jgi:hypothetical protein
LQFSIRSPLVRNVRYLIITAHGLQICGLLVGLLHLLCVDMIGGADNVVAPGAELLLGDLHLVLIHDLLL